MNNKKLVRLALATAVSAAFAPQAMAASYQHRVQVNDLKVVQAYNGSLSTTTLNFGEVDVGSSRQLSVALINSGDGMLTLSPLSTLGAAFSATTACRGTLPVNGSCVTTATFSPTSRGPASGTLSIASNAPDSPYTVTLAGTGVQAEGSLAAASGSSTNFGDAVVNSTVSRTFTFTNTGNKVATGVYATTAGTALSLSANSCGTQAQPGSVAPGASCSFTVAFSPLVPGAMTGTSTSVFSSAVNSPSYLPLTGNALSLPTADLSTTSLVFTDVPFGGPSSQSVRLTNNGSTALSLPSLPTVTGTSAFTSSTNCGSTLGVAGYCDTTVTFRPNTPAPVTATLSFATSVGSRTVSLEGTATVPSWTSAGGEWVYIAGGNRSFSASGALCSGSINGTTGWRMPTLSEYQAMASVTTAAGLTALGVPSSASSYAWTSSGWNGNTSIRWVASPSAATGGWVADGNYLTVCVKPAPDLSGPASASFPATSVGVPVTQTVTLSTLTQPVSDISFTSNHPDVTVSATTCTGSLPGSTDLVWTSTSSCTVTLRYLPSAAGTLTGAKLSVVSNSARGNFDIALSGSAGTLALSASPNPLTFSWTPTGTTAAAKTLAVQNTGTSTLTNLAIAVATGSSLYTQTNSCGTSLAAGSTCNISVTYRPTADGADQAGSITVSGTGVGTLTVPVSGSAYTPTVTQDKTSLDFGTVDYLTVSAPQLVTLTNSSPVAMSVGTPSTSAPFAVASNTCGTSLAAGASCTIGVTYSASSISTSTGLSLSVPTGAGTKTVSLTGTGAVLAKTLASYYSAVGTWAYHPTAPLWLGEATNLCSGTINGTTGWRLPSRAEYRSMATLLGSAGLTAQGVTLNYVWTTDVWNGNIRWASSFAADGGLWIATQQANALCVRPEPQNTILSASANNDFGTVYTGTTGTQVLTVRNTGGAMVSGLTLTPVGVTLSGSTCTTILTTGATCTVNANWSPTQAGALTGASVTVSSSNATNGPQTINLVGTASNVVLGVTSTELPFGNVHVGDTTSVQDVGLNNTGTSSIAVTSVTISGTNASLFSQTNNCTTLAANSSCGALVSFKPTATVTNATATLTFATPAGSRSVTLTGNGVPFTVGSGLLIGAASSVQVTPASGLTFDSVGSAKVFNGTTEVGTSTGVSWNGSSLTVNFANISGTVTSLSLYNAAGEVMGTATASATSPIGTLTANTSTTFPDAAASQGSSSLAFTYRNTSSVAITGVSATISGTGMALGTNTCSNVTVAAGATCSVTVTFTPVNTGTVTGTLTVGGSSAPSKPSLSLTGTGTGGRVLTINGTRYDLDTQVVKLTTGGTYTVVLRGNFPLTVKAWGGAGADATLVNTWGGLGGGGGYAGGTYSGTAGETLIVNLPSNTGGVAGARSGSLVTSKSGNGGNYAGVFRTSVSQANALVVAGGGSGGGGNYGGDNSGQNGAGGGGLNGNSQSNGYGRGGTTSAPGARGEWSEGDPKTNYQEATAGSGFIGGNGGTWSTVPLAGYAAGSGGGGGYFGGGGGAGSWNGMGTGGSGSSFVSPLVSGATLVNGSARFAGNNGDADFTSTNSTSNGSNGRIGQVVLR